MAEKIMNYPLSNQGRENWDRIFPQTGENAPKEKRRLKRKQGNHEHTD